MQLATSPRRRTIVAIATVGALVALLAGSAFAAITFVGTNFPLDQTRILREDTARTTNSTTFTTLPGGAVAVTVPPGQRGLIMARFSAESACSGGRGWCSVRILVNGVEAAPASGLDFAFDSTNNGQETSASWESHSMDRSIVVGPGTHVVRVEWATTSAALTFRLDDWSLTVHKARI